MVVLWYADAQQQMHRDTSTLKNGNFSFTGNANIASEALLWTDINNHIYDDKTMLRFILEPGNIFIACNNEDAIHAVVAGSKAQIEKQEWDKQKLNLIAKKNQQLNTADSLYKLHKISAAIMYKKIKVSKYTIMSMDVDYISRHRNSYLSGYLLSHHKPRLSVDSLQMLYTSLADKVKRSNLGFDILSYLYPLTTDISFRNQNPIFGSTFNSLLKAITSVYDISIPDSSGKMVSLSKFKGQYLIIDFWASWCHPCIENIPFIQKLKRKYKNDSLQILSYSVDTDGKKWKTAIRKYEFSGTQVSDLNGFYGLLPVYCKVAVGVPRYMLFDKSGKLINTDLPQPDNPELNKILDGILK
jgi:thiol-disulfide isomerase/thioredoxin